VAETFEIRNPGGANAVNMVLESPSVLSFINANTGEALSTYLTAIVPTTEIVDLLENGGSIGGTNDGDLPSLASPTAALACEAVREVAVKVNAILAALKTLGLMESGD